MRSPPFNGARHAYSTLPLGDRIDTREPFFSSLLIDSLRNAGQLPFNWEPPDGYPDDEAYWSGFILPRWNFAANAMQPGRSPVEVAPALASTKGGKSAVLNRINRFLFDGQMSSSSKTELRAFLNKGRLNPKRVREAIGIAISAPEFQQY